jgi:pyridoxal phosphate enzyme (YggS family)
MSVRENLSRILKSIPGSVTLVAVSKTKPNELIMEAYESGQRDFGENYVQELSSKHEQLPKEIRWHFIGHLQSNKVKYIAPFVHLIHGIDSLKLLREVDKQAAKNSRKINCLLQVHIASEETKFGFSAEECFDLVKSGEIEKLQNVNVCGLMGMATNTEDEKHIREEFRGLKQLLSRLRELKPEMKTLSMGMSSDYLMAIEEGSNMIRIGSTIFGERDYSRK